MAASLVDGVYRAYNEAENAHDLAATTRLVSPNLAVTINGSVRLSSGADDEQANAELFRAYPNYRREILEIIASEDRGTVRWRMVGTPADGSDLPDLDVHGCSVVTVRDGVIVAAHLYVDEAALASVLPAPT